MRYITKIIGVKLLLILSLTNSCGSKTNHWSQINADNRESTLDTNLNDLIKSYILRVDDNFSDKEWLYYYLFFYSENNQNYLTMWVFTALVNISSSKDYIYGIQNVHDRKVVIVSENHEKFKSIYFITDDAKNQAAIEKNKDYKGDIYDGDLYFETYEVVNEDGSFKYRKLPKARVSFLDILPPEEYLH